MRALRPGGLLVTAAGRDAGGNKRGDEEDERGDETKQGGFSVGDFLTLGKEMSEAAGEGGERCVEVRRRYHTLSGDAWAIVATVELSRTSDDASAGQEGVGGVVDAEVTTAVAVEGSKKEASSTAEKAQVAVSLAMAGSTSSAVAAAIVPYDEVLAPCDVVAARAAEARELEMMTTASSSAVKKGKTEAVGPSIAADSGAGATAPDSAAAVAVSTALPGVASAAARRRRRRMLEAASKTAAREGWGLGDGRGAHTGSGAGGPGQVSAAVAAVERGDVVMEGGIGGGIGGEGGGGGGFPNGKVGKLLPPLPSFHDWRDVFPELAALVAGQDVIRAEAKRVAETGWKVSSFSNTTPPHQIHCTNHHPPSTAAFTTISH
jgi:hypothetical protein